MSSLATKGRVIDYTTTQAQRAAGVTTRQMWHWMTQQVIQPSVAKAGGAGGTNMWSEDDVAVLVMLGELARLGVEADNLRILEPQLRQVRTRSAPQSSEVLVVSRSPLEVFGARFAAVGKLLRDGSSSAYWVVDLRRRPAPTQIA